MAKTSTAMKHVYVCPKCGHGFKRDLRGRGFVYHKSRGRRYCDFERGQKDQPPMPRQSIT